MDSSTLNKWYRGPPVLVAVLVPVLARPKNVLPLLESFLASCAAGVDATLFFLVSSDDREEERAIVDAAQRLNLIPPFDLKIARWYAGKIGCLRAPSDSGTWAKKINLGYRSTREPWMLLGADDLHFHAGWVDSVREHLDAGARGVIGTNDLGNGYTVTGWHSTHPLVSRKYADLHGTVDGPGAICHAGYKHNFVDNEIVATARARNEFLHVPECVVEHLHPLWGKGEDDSTYRLGQSSFVEDSVLYEERAKRYGWMGGAI